jgi:Fe-S oxidoreductase
MPEKYRRPHTHERLQAVARMQRDWAAQRQSLAIVRRFNASLSARGYSWFWPKIAAALVSKHHWLIIACGACDTVVDLDLRVKHSRASNTANVNSFRRGATTTSAELYELICPRFDMPGGETSNRSPLAFQRRRPGHDDRPAPKEIRGSIVPQKRWQR